jgi:hypothetical protein
MKHLSYLYDRKLFALIRCSPGLDQNAIGFESRKTKAIVLETILLQNGEAQRVIAEVPDKVNH